MCVMLTVCGWQVSMLNYHLREICKLLTPLPQEQMVLWGLQQDDAFFNDTSTDPIHGGIFGHVRQLIASRQEQIEGLLEARGEAHQVAQLVQATTTLLSQFKNALDAQTVAFQGLMSKLRNLHTPDQQAKFVVWCNSNNQMLELVRTITKPAYLHLDQLRRMATPASGEASASNPVAAGAVIAAATAAAQAAAAHQSSSSSSSS